jgi:branched-chain amino acid transport system substrate-binding protein
MKKILVTLLTISLLVYGLTSLTFAEENEIKIGAAVSLTGKLAYEGKMVYDGYKVWEKWVNDHGGIKVGDKAYKVKMIYYDDESKPVRGAKLTEKLITEDKVQFLMGPFSSSITFATTAIGEKYDVITIAPEANATKVYERGYKNVFSILPPATLLMVPIVELAKELDPKPETVAIIVANDLFPLSCAEGFKEACEKAGYKVILFEKYPAGATDISSLLTKVKEKNPDILGLAGYTADALMLMRQSKELKLNPKMYAISVGVMVKGFVEELGEDANYAYESEWWIPSMKLKGSIFGTTEDYLKACKEMFGADFEPDYHFSSASAAGSLLQIAIEKAGSLETAKVRDTLRGLDLELATWPAIAFNEKGQNVKWLHPVIQVQDGKYVVVYPESSREKAPVYPTPAWSKR